MRILKNRKGFTLIELIIVIAIIAILAAILIPQFVGFQDRARETQALTDAKVIATAIDAVKAETGTYTDDEAKVLKLAGLTNSEATPTYVARLNDGTKTGAEALTLEDDGGFTVAITVDSKVFKAGRDSGTESVKVK